MSLRVERGTVRRWRTLDPVAWDVGLKGSAYRLTIPAGTEFESSVPWWARWWISADDPRFLLAALVHDYLLEIQVYGRAQAAAEWFDGAKSGGAPLLKAKIAFVGLAAWAVFKPGGDPARD